MFKKILAIPFIYLLYYVLFWLADLFVMIGVTLDFPFVGILFIVLLIGWSWYRIWSKIMIQMKDKISQRKYLYCINFFAILLVLYLKFTSFAFFDVDYSLALNSSLLRYTLFITELILGGINCWIIVKDMLGGK